ncbi:MAG TPA: hypothetical protein DCS07_02330 [Bdellovibrionales bacterium]|nr:hypothetical protein [Bdellovibrionales bacterium]
MKIELIEALDQLVSAQHEFKKSHGHFTKLLNRVGYVIPATVADSIALNVQESGSRLLITATSEEKGEVHDQLTIDQDFKLHANFPLPAPRSEYLRNQAFRHMEKIKKSSRLEQRLQSVFQGYFRFEILDDSQQAKVLAKGIRPPVSGMLLEIPMELKENKTAGNLLSEVIHKFPRIRGYQTGESPFKNARLPSNTDLVIEPIE